jgi:CBS domain-containing protein
MKVGTICNENVVTICANAKLADAARLLAQSRADALVVIASPVQRPTAIGVLTDRDILRAALEHPTDFIDFRVVDILSRTPVMLNQDEEVDSAVLRLTAGDVRYAPVIGVGGTLRGAVSHQTLLRHTRADLVPSASDPTQARR